MESVVVNARIPVAKKEAARPILDQLGSTVTDLINSAYDYLVSEGRLPTVGDSASRQDADAAGFRAFVAQTTLDIDWGDDAGKSYKELLAEGKRADYESLA